ncbi:MAG: Holliday junction resolvase RuvX [Pseudomonadota bacterium]
MPEPAGTLLGFDYGERRIGVAVGHTETGLANPLTTVFNKADGTHWPALLDLVHTWKPSALVVGVPTHMDGTATSMTRRALAFCAALTERCALPIHQADERTTSRDAENIIKANRKQGRRRAHKGDSDKIAAALILQRWMESHNAGR